MMITDRDGRVAGGPSWGYGSVVITTTVAAGTYSVIVDAGSDTGAFTLTVSYPAP